MSAAAEITRAKAPPGHEPQRVPRVSDDGLVILDPWWGTIQPHQLHPETPTWGELEVIRHLESGGRLVDTRQTEYVNASGTIPGSLVIPWEETGDHLATFDPGRVTVLFCNGPQCAATPRAIKILLEAGVPAAALAYYRGGIQDWLGLGLPVATARPSN